LNIVVVECETDLYLFLSWKIRWGQFPAYHQWVACPKTGDIATLFAIGLGKPTIDVEVTCDEGILGTKSASGFLLLFLWFGIS